MITIFVTGAGGGIGQGVIKCLQAIKDLEIRIIAADFSSYATGLYTVDEAYLIPAVKEPHYIPTLIELFEREKVDFYIPGTDLELLLCAKEALSLQHQCQTKTIVSPEHAVQIADDKYKTFQFLKTNNFAAPQTFLPEEWDLQKLAFPLIVKPRIGCRSIGVKTIHNTHELDRYLSENSKVVLQEFLANDKEEYTCTIVRCENQWSEVMVLRRELRSGDTYRAFPIAHPQISEYVTRVAQALDIDGSCNFQLRLTSEGPKIFEINCRFSGTTPFCAALGFNPVEFYLKNKLGLPYEYKINYEAIILRQWQEIVVARETIKNM